MDSKRAQKTRTQLNKFLLKIKEKIRDYEAFSDIGLVAVFKGKDLLCRIAAVCEAIRRVFSIRLYDEQIICILSLMKNTCCEMGTGEGKTFSILAASFIKEPPVYVTTVNSELSRRDYEAAMKLSKFLNYKITYIGPDTRLELHNELYAFNVIFTDTSTLIFDSMRKLPNYKRHSAIIDEVDYILIDNAVSSFGLSESCTLELLSEYEKLYDFYSEIVNLFVGEEVSDVFAEKGSTADFSYNRIKQQVYISDIGLSKISTNKTNIPQACCKFVAESLLLAKFIIIKDVDYVIEESENRTLTWINSQNGRRQNNSLREFYIQFAVEWINNCSYSGVMNTLAYTTYQELFLSFENICGLSGTVKEVKEELLESYGMQYAKIKSHFENRRVNHATMQYSDFDMAVLSLITVTNSELSRGSSVLIICDSIKTAQIVEIRLKAKTNLEMYLYVNEVDEAEDVHISRKLSESVVIGTVMLGRGLDIRIQTNLTVICFGEMFSGRSLRQSMGRTGRQGKTGDFFLMQATTSEANFKQLHKDYRKQLEIESSYRLDTIKILRLYAEFCGIINEIRCTSDIEHIVKIQELAGDKEQNMAVFSDMFHISFAPCAEAKLEILEKLQTLLRYEQDSKRLITDYCRMLLEYVKIRRI